MLRGRGGRWRRAALSAAALLALAVPALTACDPVAPPANLVGNGKTLASGATIWSPNQQFRLTMQTDGNLVERTASGRVLWTTATSNHPGAYLIMQTGGVLQVRTPAGTALWATPTSGVKGATVALQDDANLVLSGSHGEPWWANGVSTVGSTRATVNSRHISTHLATFIKMYEGLVSVAPYQNAYGNCTIGYGHLIHLGNCTSADRAKSWDPDALFAADVADHEKRLKSSLGSALVNQREFDVLFDYVYGRGSITAKTSPQMYAAMTASPPAYADVPVILRANGDTMIKGLCYRRYDEADLFAGGRYDKNATSRC